MFLKISPNPGDSVIPKEEISRPDEAAQTWAIQSTAANTIFYSSVSATEFGDGPCFGDFSGRY